MRARPEKYGFYDNQPISIPVGAVREYSFSWTPPNEAGLYVVVVGLVPAQLTSYDAKWFHLP